MKKLLLLLTALSAFFSISAQISQTGNIYGSVFANQKPVEFANIALIRLSDSAIVKKTVTDNLGKFGLQYQEPGDYLISVQFVGYTNYYSEHFKISDQSAVYQVKPVVLSALNQQLGNVVVTSKKPFIEQKLDRTLVNVEASPTNVGISALEVLEKSPGITVDKDGNISLKGKQGVLILIDGKPTYLSGQDLTIYLKNMPSINLDQIEIMTNPPAKYDAAGNSGVINIKTKKSKIKGFNGSVTVGAGMGIKPKANESVNLNYRTGKVNMFGNYSYSLNKNERQLDLTRKFVDQETGELVSLFSQQTIMNRTYQSHNYKVGMDYYATKKTIIGFVINGYYNPGKWNNVNTTNIYDGSNNLQNVTLANANADEKWKNIGTNLNFSHKFDTSGTELTGDFDYLHYRSEANQLFENYFYNSTGGKVNPDEILRGTLPGDISIYSGKLDFTKSFKKDVKLEAGLKSSFVETDNNAQYDNFIEGEWRVDTGRTNHFIYKENINAAYVNVSKQLSKKWSVQTGLRLENTIADGNQLTTGETFERNYTQIFPTAYVGYTMNEKNSFSLSYGRRIERPDYGDLNPFYYFLDKYTYQVGNPYLNPQFSNNIELGHSFKGMINTTLSYTRTNNVMAEILEQVDSTFTNYVKQGNIANNTTLGLSTNANFPVTKWWRANIYAQLINSRYKGYVNQGDIDVSNTGFMTNITNQFQLKKGWNLELSGFYRSKMIEGTLVSLPMGALNFAVAKNMLKNKGTLRVSFRDFLDIQQFRGYSKYQNVDVTIRNQWDNRVVSVSFTYRFSKGKVNGPQRRTNSAQDEQNRVKGGGN